MSVPRSVRESIQHHLWDEADALGWAALTDSDRAKVYERWTRDSAIGLQLGHYMDPRKVRVYIKDTLLKPYERGRLSRAAADVWTVLGIDVASADLGLSFVKPHGRQLLDGKVVCWGKSRDWKLIVSAVFERAWLGKGSAHAAVLLETGQTAEARDRELVRVFADRLGLERVEWLD